MTECIVKRLGENIGGGCFHLCRSEVPDKFYACYPGQLEELDAMSTRFFIANKSKQPITATLHFKSNRKLPFFAESPPAESEEEQKRREKVLSRYIDKDGCFIPVFSFVSLENIPNEYPSKWEASTTPQTKDGICSFKVQIPESISLMHEYEYGTGYFFTELLGFQIEDNGKSIAIEPKFIPEKYTSAHKIVDDTRWFVWEYQPEETDSESD